MIIQCPRCGFSRDVPEAKLPATASVATCPKCSHKFKFRDLPKVPRVRNSQENRESRDIFPPSGSGATPQVSPGSEPGASRSENTSPATDSGHAPAETPPERPAGQGDIWSRLESMSDERAKETPRTAGLPGGDIPDDDLPHDDLNRESDAQGRPGEPVIDAPWERMDRFGLLGGFWETVKRAMLHPQAFFAHMPMRGIAKPLAFFLLIGCIQALAQLVWNSAGMTFMDLLMDRPEEIQAATDLGEGSYLLLLVVPVFLVTVLFAIAGLNHLFLLATRAAQRGFEATFRAVAYGSAPLVLSIIPYAGDMIGIVWNLAVTIIAYKYIHRTSYTRVALAMLIPFAFMLVLGLLTLGSTQPAVR